MLTMIQWVLLTGLAMAAAWISPCGNGATLSHVPHGWMAEAETVPRARNDRTKDHGTGLQRRNALGIDALENGADEEAPCLKTLERELVELGSKRKDLEEEILLHRRTIQQAEKRLNRLPGYSKTVQIQRGLKKQIETNRQQGKPTRSLSRLLVGVTLKLEEIMRSDEEVAAAMEGLKVLSEKKYRLERLIRQKEARAAELRREAKKPASIETRPLPP